MSVVFILIAFVLCMVEWRFELWTEVGDRVTMYGRPRTRAKTWWGIRTEGEWRGKGRLGSYSWDARRGL